MKCFLHLRFSKNLEKKKKIVFDVVWWSLFSSKLFIKQILLYQTRFACLMHLSRISSNNFYFITTLSAKHKRWSAFQTFLAFEFSKKPKKQNKIKIGLFSKWNTNHQVMSSDTDSEFEADRSSILSSLTMLLKYPVTSCFDLTSCFTSVGLFVIWNHQLVQQHKSC